MKRFLLIIAIIGSVSYAHRTDAQSSPNLVTGQIPTAQQWNSYFSRKADYLNFVGDTGTGGRSGLVPAPPAGSAANNTFLSAGGTFQVPPGSVPIPSASLLGGTGSGYTSVTVGSGLSLVGGTLSATAVPTIPTANLLGGTGTAFSSVTVGSGLSFVGGTLSAPSSGINQLTGDVTAGPGNGSQAATFQLSGTSGHKVPYLDGANTWSAAQRGTPVTVSISTSTFTPNFNAGNNFQLTLVHASCPCTLANPSTSLVAGQSGMIEVTQSSTGSDTIGTWGSDYVTAGGVATITLSTGASATDYIPYYVDPTATHIVLGGIITNPTH